MVTPSLASSGLLIMPTVKVGATSIGQFCFDVTFCSSESPCQVRSLTPLAPLISGPLLLIVSIAPDVHVVLSLS